MKLKKQNLNKKNCGNIRQPIILPRENNLMNILILSQFFSTTKGGGEYVFKTIAQIMAQAGHKVWVITNEVKNEEYVESKNLKIIRIGSAIEYKGGIPPTFLENISFVINAFLEGRKIVKNHKIDAIHSNNFSPALAGSLISSFCNIPHITTIHDVFSIYDKEFWKKWGNQNNVSKINSFLIPFFEKLMMKFSFKCIHTVSEASKNDILKLGTKKPIWVIQNHIIDMEPISIKSKNNQFLYIGRLVFYKNVEVVLKAIPIVVKKYPDVKLVIAGDGPHKQVLKKLVTKLKIEKNVNFVGYVTPEQKTKFLAESIALLFPSLIEGFGLVILEAFQQQKPVVVSKIPPMSDIVDDYKTGLLVDPHKKEKWAEAIIWLIQNPDQTKKMGMEGRIVLNTKYSQEIFYKKLLKMYDSL